MNETTKHVITYDTVDVKLQTIPNSDAIADIGYAVQDIADNFGTYATRIFNNRQLAKRYENISQKLSTIAEELDELATSFSRGSDQ